MTASVGVQLTGNGEALVRAMGGTLRTVTQQAREAAREIAGSTSAALEMGFAGGLKGVEREFRASLNSLEQLSRSASITNGVVGFDRTGQDAALVAAREQLAIQRQVAAALNAVAAEQGESSAQARVQAAAAGAAVEKAEQHVRALEQQARLLDRVQAELGETSVAQSRLNTAAVQGQDTSRAYASALQNMNFQIQDIFQGIAQGINPFMILAQQGSQLASSMQDLLGAAQPLPAAVGGAATSITRLNSAASAAKTSTLQLSAADVAAVPATNALSAAARIETGTMSGLAAATGAAAAGTAQFTIAQRVATFAAGPLGAGIIALISVIGMMAYSTRDAGDAADEGKKKLIDLTDATVRQKAAVEELRKAIDDYNQSQEKQNDSTRYSIALALDAATADLKRALAKRELLAAQLRQQEDDDAYRAQTQGGYIDNSLTQSAARKVKENQEDIARLQLEINNRTIELGKIAAQTVDPLEEVKRKYDDIAAAAERAARASRNGTAYGAPIADVLTEIERRRKAEEDAVRAQQRANSGSGAAAAANRDARVGDMVALLKQLFPGVQIISTTGGKHKPGSDHYAGRAIDFAVPGMLNAAGTEEIRRRLMEAGVDIRRNRNGTEQFFGPGRGADRPGDHDDHNHLAWQGSPDPERSMAAQQRAAEEAARAAEQLARQIADATEKSIALRGQFEPLPNDIVRARDTLIDIEQEIAKNQALLKKDGLGADQAKELQAAIEELSRTRDVLVPQSLTQPLTDELDAMREAVDAQQMLIDGRRGDYDVMQDTVDLARILGAASVDQLGTVITQRKITRAQLEDYYRQRDVLRQQTIELQQQQKEQDKLLRTVEDVEASTKRAIYDFYDGKGLGAAKNFFKSIFDIQKQVMTEETFTALFGDAFEKQKLKIMGLDKVDRAGRDMAAAINRTIDPILALGEAAAQASAQMGAANDNGWSEDDAWLPSGAKSSDIVVSMRRSMQQELRDSLKTIGDKIFGPKMSAQLGQAFQVAMQGAAYGQAASGVLRSLGVKQSGTGAAIGGAIGNAILPGIGGFIGGALGGTIGGFFKKTPKGSSTITSVTEDAAYSGSGKLRDAVSGLASSVQGSLSSIAEALGADVGAFRVSIGQRKKSFVVDPTGAGRTKGSGVLKFDNEEDAVMAALRDALADGAIKGISAAAQRILQQGKDVQAQLEKAVLIESIPKLLKARTNPVAAALDELNDKWERTVAALKEGAASAEQFADAEKLYQLEREEIMKAANDNVRDFISSLNFGSSSGLSLRDQATNARAQLQPYLDKIGRGDIAGIDRDKYLSAAEAYREIMRAMEGSGSGYFAVVDELRQASQSLVDQSETGAASAAARDPFAEATAAATRDAANILDGHTGQLATLIDQNAALLAAIGAHQDFIGANRFFTSAIGR